MSDRLLIYHCSPTLAGLKTGSMFSCMCDSLAEAEQAIAEWNRILEPKGLRTIILRFRNSRALIYVYRYSHLMTDLMQPGVSEFLKECGYENMKVEYMIQRLSDRIGNSEKFPHEIGLFLGYPLEDVKSFIANCGRNSCMTGYWKVYNNLDEARKTFMRYTKCTNVYTQKMKEGTSLDRLTVRSRYA